MYAFVFLGLWGIALVAGSLAALSAPLFQHAYIWVHYYCTEHPDMERISSSFEAHARPEREARDGHMDRKRQCVARSDRALIPTHLQERYRRREALKWLDRPSP